MPLRYSKLTPRQRGELLKALRRRGHGAGVGRAGGRAPQHRALFFRKLRALIARRQEERMRQAFDGEVEIDESYFGGHRKGKRGRGAAGKVAVFGLLKRGGKVYTQMIGDCKRGTLLPIIHKRVKPDSVVYSDTFASYNTLASEGYHHVRINHDDSLAEPGGHHINGIENFWNQAKRHLRKFNGVPKGTFYLYLKECEWRFNTGNAQDQLKSLRNLTRRR